MDQINETGHDEMLNCPKCGFQQPRDQYCAKCGVDMVKAAQARPKIPAIAIASIAILAISVGWFLYAKRSQPPQLSTDSLASSQVTSKKGPPEVHTTASEARAHEVADNAHSDYSGAARDIENESVGDSSIEGTSAQEFEVTFTAQATSSGVSPSQHSLKGQASSEMRKQLDAASEKSAARSDAKAQDVLVAFAWAEMSRELLQSLQASEPGFHQIAGLEGRLRQAAGSYQILDVVRRRMKDDSEAISLSKGELSLYFEPMKASSKEFVGGYTVQYRSSQGELRSPASSTASIAFGAGALVNMGPSNANPQNAVVILVMPRWQK